MSKSSHWAFSLYFKQQISANLLHQNIAAGFKVSKQSHCHCTPIYPRPVFTADKLDPRIPKNGASILPIKILRDSSAKNVLIYPTFW